MFALTDNRFENLAMVSAHTEIGIFALCQSERQI